MTGALNLAGGATPQSALEPAGHAARRIDELFQWMGGGALLIWVVVMAIGVFVVLRGHEGRSLASARRLIVIGGVVVPTIVLTGLLVYGLATLPPLLASAADQSMTIVVTGEQYWWRVRYRIADGDPIDLANEIRIPVGRDVAIELHAADVIHSFWVPALAGKVDMIPGRQTRLTLQADRTGEFRGVCTEYCGSGHALMSFVVVVLDPDAFDRWLHEQAAPAREPSERIAARGRDRFIASGCGACHTVRGTPADGVVGPDLTHVGSRQTLGAGILPNTSLDARHFVARTTELKPGVQMPAFAMMPHDDVEAIAVYLEGLK